MKTTREILGRCTTSVCSTITKPSESFTVNSRDFSVQLAFVSYRDAQALRVILILPLDQWSAYGRCHQSITAASLSHVLVNGTLRVGKCRSHCYGVSQHYFTIVSRTTLAMAHGEPYNAINRLNTRYSLHACSNICW